jgi:hypothetical protein
VGWTLSAFLGGRQDREVDELGHPLIGRSKALYSLLTCDSSGLRVKLEEVMGRHEVPARSPLLGLWWNAGTSRGKFEKAPVHWFGEWSG